MKKVTNNSSVDIQLVKTKAIRGLTLLVSREVAIKVIAIFGQFALVKLLLPQVFGVIAVLTFLINIADLFSDIGLVSGIIRSKSKPTRTTLSTFFVVKMFLTSLAAISLWLLFPKLENIYQALSGIDARIVAIYLVTLCLRPLRTILIATLERDLRYDVIPVVDIGGLVVYFAVALVMAASGMGIWSLVISILIKDVFEIILLEIFAPFVPMRKFSFRELKKIWRFGLSVQGNTILGVLHQSAIPFFGGIMVGARQVGLLDWGFNISSIPRALTDNVGRIAFSSFSRLQDYPLLLSKAIEETLRLGIFPMFYLLLGSVLVGKDAIAVLIGANWTEASGALSFLLLSEIALLVVSILAQAVISRGYTKYLVRNSLCGLGAQWLCILVSVKLFGFIGIAMGMAFGTITLSLLYTRLTNSAGVAFSLVRTIGPNLLVFCLSLGLMALYPKTDPTLGTLVIKSVSFTVVYFCLSMIFLHSTLIRMWSLSRKRV